MVSSPATHFVSRSAKAVIAFSSKAFCSSNESTSSKISASKVLISPALSFLLCSFSSIDSSSQALKEEIKALKVEIARLTAAPTKPSQGLQDAMGAGTAGKKVAANPDKPPETLAVPERLELQGRRILVVGHGPVGHDFIVKL